MAAVTSLALAGALALAAPASAHPSHHPSGGDPVVVADHLDNPRQLAVGPGGSLLVALAGSGGANCVGDGEGGDPFCLGDTSSIAKIKRPWSATATQRSVISGMPSGADPTGAFAIGTNGVGVNGYGNVYGVNSASAGPPAADDVAGKLFKVRHGQAVIVADLAGYENVKDPDGQGPDSDAYSVLVQPKRVLVADAAGNDVLAVDKHGHISTFHVFPNITTGPCADSPPEAPGRDPGCDFVPTALAEGPHGSVYVTGLAGETPGEGRVVQLDRHGNLLHEWSGFTTPVGVVWAGHGTFYVSELLANIDFDNPDPPNVGLVTKVSGGTRTSRVVPLPAGLAIIGHRLYVSVYSIAPGSGLFGNPGWTGQVWRMSL